MSYSVIDASSQDGAPVYKFLIVQDGTEYRYTTASYFISDSVGTWEPVALRASSVTQTSELAKNGVKIELPRTNAVAQLFLGKVPESVTSVTIYRGHQPTDLDEFQVWWRGRVAAVSVAGDTVTLECEDIFTSMRRPGLRARYQKSCRHPLYSAGCGVDPEAYAVGATIIAQDGFDVVIEGSGDSNFDSNWINDNDGYYVGGIVKLADGTRRYVAAQNGTTLTLLSPFDTIDVDSVGVDVTLYPGCLHTTTDCLSKFDNLVNYGGFPYIPGKNPFGNSVSGSIV